MENSSEKLTGSVRCGYDGYMSETGAAVLESSTKTEDELKDKWAPELIKAGSDSNLRDAIMSAIRRGEEPRGDLGQEQLRKMSQEEVNRKFSEMTDNLEVRKPEDMFLVDKILDHYAERVKGWVGKSGELHPGELKDDSSPPGEILKDLDTWEDYGWSDDERKEVKNELKDQFRALGNADEVDKQAEIIMEILVSHGKTGAEFKGHLSEMRQEAHELWISKKEKDDLQFRRQYSDKEEIFFMMEYLGIEDIQIRHFISPDLYVHDNDQEIDYSAPKNVEELAWQMMQTPGKQYRGWGVKGESPLLEMRILKDANRNVDTEKSRYRVNTANMVLWARSNMYIAYDLDRETPHNFFQEIALKKRYPLSLQEMLLNPSQYFVSEDGIQYKQLLLEWYKEAAVMTTVRAWDVMYRKVAGDPDELAKAFREMYNTENLLTRNALGANLINLMTTMPLHFKGVEDGKWQSDSKMGAAWMDIYRAYDSMSDLEGLKRVLGEGSKFFTLKGWVEAIGEVGTEGIAATGVDKYRVFMGKEYYEFFEKSFDKNGEITTAENKKNFIKFISIFGPKMIGGKVEWTVRAALRGAIAEKFGTEVYVKDKNDNPIVDKMRPINKDGTPNYIKKHAFITDRGKKNENIEDRIEDMESLKVSEAIAWSLVKPFGAGAKNDADAVGHDWMQRVYNTQLMRQKYPHRGDKFGNEHNIMQFKRTGVDALNAIVTEAYTEELDDEGKPIKGKDGKLKTRNKTIMEVMRELSAFKTASANRLKELEMELIGLDPASAEYREKKQNIKKISAEDNQIYQDKAQDMSFGQRTLSNYWEDHLKFGIDLYKQLVESKEIAFEKFTDYNVFGGVRFKQAEFQQEIQDTWIHKIRYMIDTYPSLNFNQTVRVMDQTETTKRHYGEHRLQEPAYHEVKLGEAMFGHEMLNRAEFWKRDKHDKPINLIDSKGRKIKGKYEIDYQKVQDNKQQVWKQWFMMKVATDLFAHRALHANEPRFNFTYYQNAVEAIGRIPGDIMQDEFNMKQTDVTKYFFNKSDIAWLRKTGRVQNFDLYWKAMVKDVLLDDKPEEGIGIFSALALAMKAIVRDKV